MRSKTMRELRLLAAGALVAAVAGCSSDPAGPSGSSGTVPPISGRYMLKIDVSGACAGFPIRTLQWSGDAGVGSDAAVFRVVNPSDPGDPTSDHVRLLLRASGGGSLAGELRLQGAYQEVPLDTGGEVTGTVRTGGLAGATGTLSGGGRPEIRDGRLAGTLLLEWGWMGTGYSASCTFDDHRFTLVPM